MKSGPVLVLAPTQGNSAVVCNVLVKSGIAATACANWGEFAAQLGAGGEAALFAEEALVPEVIAQLTMALRTQPPWSDLPVLILARVDGSGFESSPALESLRGAGNVT